MNTEVTGWRRWIPTDKWLSALGVGLASIAGSWINTGAFDGDERAMLATLIPSLATAYFISNKDRLGQQGS